MVLSISPAQATTNLDRSPSFILSNLSLPCQTLSRFTPLHLHPARSSNGEWGWAERQSLPSVSLSLLHSQAREGVNALPAHLTSHRCPKGPVLEKFNHHDNPACRLTLMTLSRTDGYARSTELTASAYLLLSPCFEEQETKKQEQAQEQEPQPSSLNPQPSTLKPLLLSLPVHCPIDTLSPPIDCL
ncbi:uncharacterized protein BO72DRAFT_57290 [Aspergillus fijiensis CBS 313.89]|uniref:Uncharacterized protein n=1 Tax=Aspergillus fijiensis CBS 313.89 TaxID=1448319 RepID=A0A8G1RSQ6_9EURO|nr:uncharacterized protein BO72DRAFT_57290 [Aspergillus fijiensis CBS 313.89]RAK78785.1 hypothetical protein BO72DRAFT_57290 [Aspergillus fijiensis CBS 313.89]